MSGLTLSDAERQLKIWLAASEAVAQGQSYSISTEGGSRSLSRTNAQEILKQIQFWDAQVKRLSRGGLRVRRAVILND